MLLRIKVKPNAKSDEVLKGPDGSVLVRIKAPPADGKANKHLIAFLAGFFGLPQSKIILMKGKTNQFKTIEISADEETVNRKLDAL